jgi:hypothetical protein
VVTEYKNKIMMRMEKSKRELIGRMRKRHDFDKISVLVSNKANSDTDFENQLNKELLEDIGSLNTRTGIKLQVSLYQERVEGTAHKFFKFLRYFDSKMQENYLKAKKLAEIEQQI